MIGIKVKLAMIGSMLAFGSLGVFVRMTALPSGVLAMLRGLIGAVFLFAVFLLSKRGISKRALRENAVLLLCSGAALGANWIFLFEAYRHSTIAAATLSYYTAPVLIVAVSPWALKERLSPGRAACVGLALAGMALVSGIFAPSGAGGNFTGILLGLCAAVAYASLTLMNKFVRGLSPMETTMAQLGIAAAVQLPYTLAVGTLLHARFTPMDAVLLLVLGIFHTGIAFLWFFSSVRELRGQTVAVMSYLDPVTAILLSTLVLREHMSLAQAAGALLILGSTLLSELLDRMRGPHPEETERRSEAASAGRAEK